MEQNTIQTTGTYNHKEDYFSIVICPNDNHAFTLEGLSVEDMKELKSLVDILLEEYYDIQREQIEADDDIWEQMHYSDESGTKKETIDLLRMEEC